MTHTTPSSSKTCERCGLTYSPEVAEGLCPGCLGALNFEGETTVLGSSAPTRQAPPSPEDLGPIFPQLEILECLGRGGMGVVYKARQKSLGRFVALKLLAPEREKDADFAARFTQEAQALAALNHPHIVTVHDFGQSHGYFFLLMEYVDGPNLRELLRARRLTPEEALAIVPPLCDALQFAHERGIVHCDIKPENLLLDRDGRVKVADFGVARILGGETPRANEARVAGTPGYMAPEQSAHPLSVDSRADIYSLGVVFYEMLTGELPGDKLLPPSRKIAVDVRIDEVVLRALERTPELRWQTAADLRTEVESISARAAASGGKAARGESTGHEHRRAVSPRRWVIALVVALAIAVILPILGFAIPMVLSARANKARQLAQKAAVVAEEQRAAAAAEATGLVTLKTFAAADLRQKRDGAPALPFQVSGPETDPVVKLKNEPGGPMSAEILTLELPGIDAPVYVLRGDVRYEDVEGSGFLEMWSHFGAAAYFSRTMGMTGPMGVLHGNSDWRVFTLPFNATGATSNPTKLVFNVQLPGKGTVELRGLRLMQQAKGK